MKKKWVVVYKRPDGKLAPSEYMYKWTALDYLEIFNDALWIQKILFRRRIYPERELPTLTLRGKK